MRTVAAVVAPVVGSFRVDSLSPSSCGRLYQPNFVNAKVCLATQEGAQRVSLGGCSPFQKLLKGLETGRPSNQRSAQNSLACRCLESEDSINAPNERAGVRDGQGNGGETDVNNGKDSNLEEEAGPSSVWDLPARHKRMQVFHLESDTVCLENILFNSAGIMVLWWELTLFNFQF